MPDSVFLTLRENLFPIRFVDINCDSIGVPVESNIEYCPNRFSNLLIIESVVSNTNPLAAGDSVIAEPGDHPCRVQYKNSLAVISQF